MGIGVGQEVMSCDTRRPIGVRVGKPKVPSPPKRGLL